MNPKSVTRWIYAAEQQLTMGSKSGYPPTWEQIDAAKECLARAVEELKIK